MSTFEDLLLVRRIVKETRNTQSPGKVKKEYVTRKRSRKLERVLIPDAPPRKRARQLTLTKSVALPSGNVSESVASPSGTALESVASQLMCDWTTSIFAQIPNGQGDMLQGPFLRLPTTEKLGVQVGSSAAVSSPQQNCSTTRKPSSAEQVGGSAARQNKTKRTFPPRQNPSPTSYFSDSVAPSDQIVTNKEFLRRAKKNKPAVTLPSSLNTPAVTALPSSSNTPAVTALPSSKTPAVTELPSSSGQSQGINVDAKKGQEIVSNLLEEISEMESDEELPIADTVDFDYANEAPAFAHEGLDANKTRWLTQLDNETDQLLKDTMTGDDQLTFEWTNDVASFLEQREEFRGQSGPTFLIDDNTKPVDVFLKYFTDVLDVIVSETNRHMASIVGPLQRHSRFQRHKETDRSEMAIFTAMLILQGLCPLPVENDYWSENGYLTLKYFKTLMSCKRFMLLKRLLHFTENSASTEKMTLDEFKLRKLGPLLNILNRKFSELYLTSRDIAIDESLLKWHGRLGFAQKIATKAAKVGVKSYELCESSTGYLWMFFIYTGKGQPHGQADIVEQDEDQTDAHEQVSVNVTAHIVVDLVKPLLNRGHTLTMDNFFNSPLLARYLKANGTDCLGTLRVNRKFVPESIKGMSKSELRPGEIVQTYCRDMSILLWRDNNLVALISTFHKGEIGGKEKYGQYKYKPQAVLDYNLSMGGVDRKDQRLSSHPIERKRNQTWYKKVYRRLLNVTVFNAYTVYKTNFPKVSQREFRSSLANELIAMFRTSEIERPLDVQVLPVIRARTRERCIVSGNHFIGQGHSKYSRCVLCKKSRTSYICKQCKVALCIDVCFERYHTKG